MEMFLLFTGCALFAIGTVLIVGPGKRSTPIFTTGAVTGLLGTASIMAYSLVDGLSPFKIVLFALWILVIAATAVYVIRMRKRRRDNQSDSSAAEHKTPQRRSALAEMTEITQQIEKTSADTNPTSIKRLSELDD